MPADSLKTWSVRFVLFPVFAATLYYSWHIARVDALTFSGRPGDLERALQMDPGDETLWRRKALTDLSNGPVSKQAELEFTQALKLNPRDSTALLNLGLIAEAQGDMTRAEQLFLRAADVDGTLKPAWTLANFYVRTGQTDRMDSAVRKCLDVMIPEKDDLLNFGPASVFDLCWQAGMAPARLLALVPKRKTNLIAYFDYVVRKDHFAAAKDMFPLVLPFASGSLFPYQRESFLFYCEALCRQNRIQEAVQVWNEMVRRQVFSSTELHLEGAESIADPTFENAPKYMAFNWMVLPNPKIGVFPVPHALRYEFSGDEAEGSALLQKLIPVLPGRRYSLTVRADASGITRPSVLSKSGLSLLLTNDRSHFQKTCDPILGEPKIPCTFQTPADVDSLSLKMIYARPAGEVRMRGDLVIQEFRLAFAGS